MTRKKIPKKEKSHIDDGEEPKKGCRIPLIVCSKPDDPIESIENGGVEMFCTNRNCQYSPTVVHAKCFNKLEERLVTNLKNHGASQKWPECQIWHNLWISNGLGAYYKLLKCRCGGFLHKNRYSNSSDRGQEDSNLNVHEGSKKGKAKKLPELKIGQLKRNQQPKTHLEMPDHLLNDVDEIKPKSVEAVHTSSSKEMIKKVDEIKSKAIETVHPKIVQPKIEGSKKERVLEKMDDGFTQVVRRDKSTKTIVKGEVSYKREITLSSKSNTQTQMKLKESPKAIATVNKENSPREKDITPIQLKSKKSQKEISPHNQIKKGRGESITSSQSDTQAQVKSKKKQKATSFNRSSQLESADGDSKKPNKMDQGQQSSSTTICEVTLKPPAKNIIQTPFQLEFASLIKQKLSKKNEVPAKLSVETKVCKDEVQADENSRKDPCVLSKSRDSGFDEGTSSPSQLLEPIVQEGNSPKYSVDEQSVIKSEASLSGYPIETVEIDPIQLFELELLSSLTKKPISELTKPADSDILEKIYAFSDKLRGRNPIDKHNFEGMKEFDKKYASDIPVHDRIKPKLFSEERDHWYWHNFTVNESSYWPK